MFQVKAQHAENGASFSREYFIKPPLTNPLSRILAGTMTLLALGAAFFFGVIVLVLAVGIGLLFWLSIRLRLWLNRRHIPSVDPASASRPRKGEVIDVEYTVVSRQKD